MRILMFDYEFPPFGGGVGEAGYYLLREYSRNAELQIDFVTSSADTEYHMLQMGENITIHRLPIVDKGAPQLFVGKNAMAYSWRAYKFSCKLIKMNEYDLSHSFYSIPCGFVSLLLKWRHKLPYVVSLNGADVPGYDTRFAKVYGQMNFFVARALNNAYFIAANSLKIKESASSSTLNKEIVIINKGIDVEEFFPDESRHNQEQVFILCDSEIVTSKGVRFLVQAFKLLSGRYRQARLIIIGEGKERKSLEDLVRGLEIEDKVVFLGEVAREKVVEYYQKASIFVLPTLDLAEYKGPILRNALAAGLPIVATAVSGTEELIIENNNGFVVKASNADDLAEKIERLLVDAKFRETMSKNSRQFAERLSWSVIADAYLDLYVKTKNLGHIRQE